VLDKANFHAIGVDIDPNMISFASKTHSHADSGNGFSVEFVCQDATNLPYEVFCGLGLSLKDI
jgi:ubiquinone/menaquinone biosynthesis C-methylase UbiE